MNNQLINGDCLEEMAKLKDKSIDMVLADIPYNCHDDKCDKDIIDLNLFWEQFKRVRKSKETPCIMFANMRFAVKLITSNSKMFKFEMILKKKNVTGGLLSRFRPMVSHELILFFYEKQPIYNRDLYHTRINNVKMAKSSCYAGTESHHFENTKNIKRVQSNFSPTLPKSIFESNICFKKRLHKTQKPTDILEFLIKYWTDEGDTILDPTMGSGSSGVACKTLNRHFVGIELDTEIFNVAEKRIRDK